MIRHRERSLWLPLSIYLSDNATAIIHASDYLGGQPLAMLAQSVIDEVRMRQEPTRRLIEAIERLLRLLNEGSQKSRDPELAPQAIFEQDFAIRAEICLLVDELLHTFVAFQTAVDADVHSRKKGAA